MMESFQMDADTEEKVTGTSKASNDESISEVKPRLVLFPLIV